MTKTDAFNLGAMISSAPYNPRSCMPAARKDSDFASQLPFQTKVQRLVRMCGIRMTALYLKNRGYTPEQAVTLMFR